MHLRGIGYALVASLLLGLGAVFAQLVGKEMDATVVAIVALAVGSLLLAVGLMFTGISLAKALHTFNLRDSIDLFLLSFFGTALPLLLIVAGFARTSALVGGFLLQLNGLAAVFFAVLLLRERIHLKQCVGIVLLLLGGSLVVFKGTQGIAWGSGGMGDLLILAGALGIGFGFIPAKRLTERIDPLPLTAIRLLIGACTLVPILALQLLIGNHIIHWQPSLTTLWIVLPIYIITNFCLGYLAQQAGLRLLKAWEMAGIMQTVPLFSTAAALLFLHDSLTLVQAVGGLIAIIGGVVVSFNKEAQFGLQEELEEET
jgi:drug/metabolite transporter (DMT)-like permease